MRWLLWIFDAIRFGLTGNPGHELSTKLGNLNAKLVDDGIPPVTLNELRCAARFGIKTRAEIEMERRREEELILNGDPSKAQSRGIMEYPGG